MIKDILIAVALFGVLVGPIWFILWAANQPTRQPKTKTVIDLNQVCDELDRMCGAPTSRKEVSTKITIQSNDPLMITPHP